MCKVQGHSSPGVTEWDWSKFEAQPGLGGVGDNAGEVVVKAGETPQAPCPWQALPVDSKTTTKTDVRHPYILPLEYRHAVERNLEELILLELACQVPTAGHKSDERNVGTPRVGSEHEGLEAPPIAKWLVDGENKKRTSDDTNDRYCYGQASDAQQLQAT